MGPMKQTFFLKHWRRASALVVVALVAIVVTGCSTVPVTGRSQFNLLSPGHEAELGLTAFEETKKQVPISKDKQVTAMVQRVGQRIAAVASKDLPDAQWEFVVFDSPEANAFCLPGGKVGIYTGILPITKDEAGMATVIGHEIAHAVARHGGERVSRAMMMQGGGALLGVGMQAFEVDPRWQAISQMVYGTGGTLLGELPHSRKQESEADYIGLMYMAQAGYPPEAAVEFWQRFGDFNKQKGGDTLWFLRTHPVDETRIKQIQEWIPEAKAAASSAAR
jgi:metalloendopeptidase OMA1, mitochondrial